MKPNTTTENPIKKIFSIIDPRSRAMMPIAILFAFIFSALETAGIALVFPFLQVLTGQAAELPDFVIKIISKMRSVFADDTDTIGSSTESLVLLIFAAFIMKSLVGVFLLRWNYRYALRIKARLTESLFTHYLAAPLEWHLKKNAATVIRNFQSANNVISAILIPTILVLPDVLLIFLIAFVLFRMNSSAVLVCGIMLGAVVYLNHFLTRARVKQVGRDAVESYGAVVQRIMECLGSVREIQLLGAEQNMFRFFKDNNDRLLRAQFLQFMLQTMPRYILEIAFVIVAAGLYLIGTMWSDQSVTLPFVGLFAFAAIRMLPAVSRVVTALQQVRSSLHALDVVYDDFKSIRPLLAYDQNDTVIEGTLKWKKIELMDVEVTFAERERAALKNINFEIRNGESLGIVGATGAGKSTFINLISGFLEQNTGDVLLDGRPMVELRRKWQGNIGIVPQHVFLLDDTIRQNIAFGLRPEEIDEATLLKVANFAQLSEVIQELPEGFDTVVGERGSLLSGGQMQRIGIARALYRNPTILILDEATSSLDNETEAKIYENFRNQPKEYTIINIAHRLSTMRYMDRILFLKEGKIADEGKFDELLGRNPNFKQMVSNYDARNNGTSHQASYDNDAH